MNQTKKRLSIINLAISITDIETIQLQILQLGPLRTDEKIQEIITALKAENYVQAQGLITAYIETPIKEILQRTFQKEQEKRKIQDNNTIDEFNLFTEPEDKGEIKTLDFDDMMAISDDPVKEEPEEVQKNIDFDSLLNIDTDDILPNNIKLNVNTTASNSFWDKSEEINMQTDAIPKDTFFDSEESTTKILKETLIEEKTEEITESIKEESTQREVILEEPLEEVYTEEAFQEEVNQETEDIDTFEKEAKKILKELKPQKQENVPEEDKKYKAIPYIEQKFKNMHVQYPPMQETLEVFPSVKAWLLQISTDGYNEEDIDTMIKKIEALSVEHKEESAQLLLITAATESKYAQFRLARILYKGDILQKNLSESFTIINRLATHDDYPEAICDLAQFYEYGIGIDKDKKKAELLYEEAMNAGIKRAMDHYERIKKQNSGLFSFLKK